MAMPDVTWVGDFFSARAESTAEGVKAYSSGTTRTAPLSALVAKAA